MNAMKTMGLTTQEARESEDFVINMAQQICDFFKTELKGYEFEEVMLFVKKSKLEGYREAGEAILKKL